MSGNMSLAVVSAGTTPAARVRALSRGGAHLRGELRGTPLTPRELDVLRAIASPDVPGKRASTAASAALGIRPNTVRRHLATLQARLGVGSIDEAIYLLREVVA